MTTRFIEWPVMQWAIVLGLGFPLLMLALGELAYRSRKNPGVASTLKNLRNLVLPTLAIWLVLREVVQLPADHRAIKFSETAFWIALIYSALTFVNEVIFASASAESLASRVPKLLLDLLRLILVVLGGSIVLSKVWGMDLTSLATALGVGSIVIGLALQEPLGNVFAGLMLLFEHPVSVGDWIEVEGKIGQSVMEQAIQNDVPGIEADCGGACSCATCQVYIEPEWFDKTGPATSRERAMLDFAERVEETSRLSCQIPFTEELDGLRVRMPESQRD